MSRGCYGTARSWSQISKILRYASSGLYESQLKHLGSIALKGLLEENLDFDEQELGKKKESDLPGFGFLSVQP